MNAFGHVPWHSRMYSGPTDLSSLLSASSLSRVIAFPSLQTWYLFSLPRINYPLAHTTSSAFVNPTQPSGLSLDVTSFKSPSPWVSTSKPPEHQSSYLSHLVSTSTRDAMAYKTDRTFMKLMDQCFISITLLACLTCPLDCKIPLD